MSIVTALTTSAECVTIPCRKLLNRPYTDKPTQGNQDGQPQTNFGALAAYQVPWIVLPDDFATTYSKDLPGNNVAAVIW